jgi:hypothetical protein
MNLPDQPPKSARSYEIGDRVKLSDFGKSRSPKLAGLAVVVAIPRGTKSAWVRFDGNKTPTPLHASYIEPA